MAISFSFHRRNRDICSCLYLEWCHIWTVDLVCSLESCLFNVLLSFIDLTWCTAASWRSSQLKQPRSESALFRRMGCVPSSVQSSKPITQSSGEEIAGTDMGPLTDTQHGNEDKHSSTNSQELLVNSLKVSLSIFLEVLHTCAFCRTVWNEA